MMYVYIYIYIHYCDMKIHMSLRIMMPKMIQKISMPIQHIISCTYTIMPIIQNNDTTALSCFAVQQIQIPTRAAPGTVSD